MAKKANLKTVKTRASVSSFISKIEDDQLRKDCRTLLKVFRSATGMKPKMWGTVIIGFGEYAYLRANGEEGLFLATGFSPRKSGPTIYIMPGYTDYSAVLKDLGPHRLGKSCLYLKNLEGINFKILTKLIRMSLKDLKKTNQTKF